MKQKNLRMFLFSSRVSGSDECRGVFCTSVLARTCLTFHPISNICVGANRKGNGRMETGDQRSCCEQQGSHTCPCSLITYPGMQWSWLDPHGEASRSWDERTCSPWRSRPESDWQQRAIMNDRDKRQKFLGFGDYFCGFANVGLEAIGARKHARTTPSFHSFSPARA